MKMKLPVRIFSDLHLGHKASRIVDVEALRPLFRGAGTVVLNGDTWEELSAGWRDSSAAMLGGMQRVLSEEGCEVVFLPGNHDPGWPGCGWLELAGGKIVVSHGDALLWGGAPWKREVRAGRGEIERMWAEFPEAGWDGAARHELARRVARRFSNTTHCKGRSRFARLLDAVFPPSRLWEMVKAWAGQGRLAGEFCERYFPAAELIVYGHFHCAGVRRVGARTALNLGSFVVPGRAMWAEWDGVNLKYGNVFEKSEDWGLGGAEEGWKFN